MMDLMKEDRKAVRECSPCFKSCDVCIRRWHNPLTWLHLKSFLTPDDLTHSLNWCTHCAGTVTKQEMTRQLSRRDRSAERPPKTYCVARSVNRVMYYETVGRISPFF